MIAAALFAAKNLDVGPAGGGRTGALGRLVLFAIVAHFVLGVLMMFGIGLYAPSLATLSLLGLNPAAAFPIMMGACAFLMPVSALGFVRSARIDLRVILGIAIGGIPAVLLAAYVVKSLPLVWLRWAWLWSCSTRRSCCCARPCGRPPSLSPSPQSERSRASSTIRRAVSRSPITTWLAPSRSRCSTSASECARAMIESPALAARARATICPAS